MFSFSACSHCFLFDATLFFLKNATQKALTHCQKQQLKAAIMVKMTAQKKKAQKKNVALEGDRCQQ